MYDATHTIDSFLTATAAKQPTPGGGSVTALVGALAAAIGEMVLNYSVGKKNLAEYEPELKTAVNELYRARRLLLSLMAEDQSAYAAMTALRKLPETSPERQSKELATLLACIRIPEAMAATGVAILDVADHLAKKVNPYLLSDLAVCTELAMATVRCALYNVKVNLAGFKDAAERKQFEDRYTATVSRATALVRSVMPKIWGHA
jgi:formiminotetrahydrofolate cyclodeaminase